MASSHAQQRAAIQKDLAAVRKLLNDVRPLGMLAILQDVGEIERDAIVASAYELPGVSEKLRRLMEQMKRTGVITAERFQKFFAEAQAISKTPICRKRARDFWNPAILGESVRRYAGRTGDSRKAFRLRVFGKLLMGTIRRADSNAKLLCDLRPGMALLAKRNGRAINPEALRRLAGVRAEYLPTNRRRQWTVKCGAD